MSELIASSPLFGLTTVSEKNANLAKRLLLVKSPGRPMAPDPWESALGLLYCDTLASTFSASSKCSGNEGEFVKTPMSLRYTFSLPFAGSRTNDVPVASVTNQCIPGVPSKGG
ncbi:hypothetical protein MT325_m102L [Paramecium bursaria chlorella virus MT325]|uniref:Uncharacterized protein m102L n=1 Tax=Paramecium bursaria Chlorella virus MT325 TaxID=346932 RepID=A7ITI2_PBCVM|nr:hypothetical protein MT325_m102L [Paramecium bursaria chlorella virus MT325]